MFLRVEDIRAFDSEFYRKTLASLPGLRRRQITSLPSKNDRFRSLLGEHMAYSMLSEYLSVSPAQIVIRRSVNGKPLVQGAFFSVSHSGSFVACAVDSIPVGVDIELLRPMDPRLVPRMCNPNEREAYFALSRSERSRFLLSLWVLKEAWIKCTDSSLLGMARIGFSLGADGAVSCTDPRFDCAIRFSSSGFVLATCREMTL